MAEATERQTGTDPDDEALKALGHPRGTLAIVLVYGVLFALGWLALYVFEFLPRGLPQ
jgi:hypothetical protein